MLEQVEWGEFKLGNLFNIENTLSFNKDRLTDGDDYDYVTRTSLNQGILQSTGFVNSENLNESGVRSLGLLQMDFFFRRKKRYAGQFIRKIIPKFNLSQSSILFFSVILNGTKNKLLSVLVRDVDDTFRETVVKLPIKNGTIDFEFINKFIAELEAKHQAELEAYLEITGLKNYELTSDELNILKELEEGKIKWKEFNLEDLFGKSTRGKRLKSEDRIPGELPFVTAGEAEEGISAFIGNDVTVFSKNTTTIDMFGSAKYRNYEYGGDDHVAIVHTEKLEKYAAIFVTTAIHKSSHNGQFDYGKNFYAKDADELNIQLPIKNNEVDYNFMKMLISAVHKLIIKDVVNYNQERLKATTEIINN